MILKAHSLRNAPTHFLRKRVSTTSQVEIYDFFLMNSVLLPLMKLFALITLLIKIEIFMLCIVPMAQSHLPCKFRLRAAFALCKLFDFLQIHTHFSLLIS